MYLSDWEDIRQLTKFEELNLKSMRLLRTYLLPFISGLLITAMIHVGYRCQKENDDPQDTGITADLVQMEKDAALAETAFLSGDIEQVKLVMTEDTYEFYKEVLENQAPDKLIEYGNALKSRELNKYSAIYAEYTFTGGKKTYTVGFAVQADKSWKITRF